MKQSTRRGRQHALAGREKTQEYYHRGDRNLSRSLQVTVYALIKFHVLVNTAFTVFLRIILHIQKKLENEGKDYSCITNTNPPSYTDAHATVLKHFFFQVKMLFLF